MRMVRYADDFVCLFQYEQEAQKFYRMLVERMKKFGLELAEDKSRIMPFGRYKGTKESFDFLGFTHYNGKSHWGEILCASPDEQKETEAEAAVGERMVAGTHA